MRPALLLLLLTLTAGLAPACLRPDAGAARPANGAGDTRSDLNGVWSFATLTPLERPAELAGKATFTEEEARAFEQRTLDVQNRDRRDGDGADGRGSDGRTDLERAYNQAWWDYGTQVLPTRQTSLVVDPPDGRIPPASDAARRRAADAAAQRVRPPDGPEDRTLTERCIHVGMAGPPLMPGPYNNNVQIVQGTTHVAIHNEMIHDTRLVPIGHGAPLPPSVRQWFGDSRGRWEGKTLVVETTNFRPETAFRGASEAMRLVERFTRTSPDVLLYQYTVTDDSSWQRPWSVALPMRRSADPIYEYACHEGNYGLAAILAGARADERAGRR